jgi:hypothetical protein
VPYRQPRQHPSFATSYFATMGQHWTLINIDKCREVELTKFGEFYTDMDVSPYLRDDRQYSWAGDRVILLGVSTEDIPAGIIEDNDTQDIPAGIIEDNDTPDRFASNDNAASTFYCRGGYKNTSVLRNLCTREYIRADLFPG